MKKLIIIAAVLLATIQTQAQRYCVIDSKYILENVPEYKQAQTKLDEASSLWQKEIDAKLQDVDRMYKAYQAEQVMLSEEMKKQREEEIMNKEKEVREMQRQKFGPEGALFKKREELVKPIQDKVYAAIQKFAEDKGYEFVFDKGSASGMLYADKRNDKTEDVKTMLKKG